jgi:hypothetical protein
MKRKIKREPFNAMVLRRREEKRMRSRFRLRMAFFVCLMLIQIGLTGWQTYMRTHRSVPGVVTAASAPQRYKNSTTEDGVPVMLNINGDSWYVVRAKDFTYDLINAESATVCNAHVIVYLPSQTPSLTRNSLVHEVFHAGACLHGGDEWWNSVKPTRSEHPGIFHLADFWTGFARANPEFMEWLAR